MTTLKLTALDEEDLGVISAHLQDAVLTVGDIRYLKAAGKLALALNRFAWEDALTSGVRRRCRSIVHFEQVKSVKAQRVRMDDPEAVLSLLAIGFTPGEAPSGEVTLTFAGGGTLKLAVDCIEARLEDQGPVWDTPRQPSHEA